MRVVAVTKGFDAGAATAALDAGLVDIGENYAQELLAKADELRDLPDAVFSPGGTSSAGSSATRSARSPIWCHLWQSVDRIELATEIARRAPGARVLVQVDMSPVSETEEDARPMRLPNWSPAAVRPGSTWPG